LTASTHQATPGLEESDGLYRLLSLDGRFSADPVDAYGLVLDYPELCKRALP
jgi:hypothetical protein